MQKLVKLVGILFLCFSMFPVYTQAIDVVPLEPSVPTKKSLFRTGDKQSQRGGYSCTDWCTLEGKVGKFIHDDALLSYSAWKIAPENANKTYTAVHQIGTVKINPQEICQHTTTETMAKKPPLGSPQWCQNKCMGEGGVSTRIKGKFKGETRKQAVSKYINAVNGLCWDAEGKEKPFKNDWGSFHNNWGNDRPPQQDNGGRNSQDQAQNQPPADPSSTPGSSHDTQPQAVSSSQLSVTNNSMNHNQTGGAGHFLPLSNVTDQDCNKYCTHSGGSAYFSKFDGNKNQVLDSRYCQDDARSLKGSLHWCNDHCLNQGKKGATSIYIENSYNLCKSKGYHSTNINPSKNKNLFD